MVSTKSAMRPKGLFRKNAVGRFAATLVWVLAFLFLPMAGPWASGLPDAPVAAAAKENGAVKLLPDPAVRFGRLPNGIGYALMQNTEPKERVSMHLVVQAGSFHERPEERGLAHFLEHMMFNGSVHFPPGELVRYFQRIGMQFGPDANARTGFMETVYDVLLPDGKREDLAGGLLVLKDYARGALLLPEEIERERGVILSEKRSRDSADYRTFVSTLKFAFPEARFSGRLPIGTEEVIRAADREVMKGFYDAWYRPEKMFLVLVGTFDMSVATELIGEMFGGVSAAAPPRPEPDFGTVSHQGVKTFYHYEAEAGLTSVSLEVARKVDRQPDSVALRRENLLLDMANRIVQHRLDAMVGDASAPFTDASAAGGWFLEKIRYAELRADCNAENWEKTLCTLEKVLRSVLAHGVTELEVARVKKEILSELQSAVEQAPTRHSDALAREIIRHVNRERIFLSPSAEQRLLAPMVQTASVQQIHGALKRAWGEDHRLVLVTGDVDLSSQKSAPQDRIRAVFEKSRLQALPPLSEKAAFSFPYLPVPTPGGIDKKREVADLGIFQVDFENNVRLNIKRTLFEAGKIRVNVAFGAGRSAEPVETPGLSLFAAEVADESGLGQWTKTALDGALAGTDVDSRLDVEEDQFLLRGAGSAREATLLFQLLHARLVDPGFRKEAAELVCARYRQRYQALSRDIDGAMALFGRQFLAGGDHRFGMPTPGAMEAYTLAQARRFLMTPFSKGPIEVSVVGDIEPAEVVRLAALYFGSLPPVKACAPLPPAKPPVAFPAGRAVELPVDTKIPKGLVVVAFGTDDFWNIGRTRRLSVLADIFSELLREKIREQLGASYSPFAYNRSSRAYPGYGVFEADIYVSPVQAALVTDAVKDIAGRLAAAPVAPNLLARCLEPMLTSIKDYRRTNGYWLDRVLTGSCRHPRQLAWSRSFAEDYAAVTAEELHALAAAYLRADRAAVLTIVPGSAAK